MSNSLDTYTTYNLSVLGNVLAVPFSPDPSALRNICQNDNVKVGGPVGATPRVPTCPSGRETSIYSVSSLTMVWFELRVFSVFMICDLKGNFFSWVVLFLKGSTSSSQETSKSSVRMYRYFLYGFFPLLDIKELLMEIIFYQQILYLLWTNV